MYSVSGFAPNWLSDACTWWAPLCNMLTGIIGRHANTDPKKFPIEVLCYRAAAVVCTCDKHVPSDLLRTGLAKYLNEAKLNGR